MNVLASLTNNVALKTPCKYLINDAVTMMRVIFDQYWSSFAVSVKNVQCRDEKFMSILLLITSQMSGVRPN